jgi:hypothetical protein
VRLFIFILEKTQKTKKSKITGFPLKKASDKRLKDNDAVLHNKLTVETVISFRGTTSNIKETKAFLKDWEVNIKLFLIPKVWKIRGG